METGRYVVVDTARPEGMQLEGKFEVGVKLKSARRGRCSALRLALINLLTFHAYFVVVSCGMFS